MEDKDQRFGDDAGAIAEWDAFLADNRHLRYEDTPANWYSLFDFLKEHQLYFNCDSLHFAFVTLHDTLELTPFATPLRVVVEKQPAHVPEQPAPQRISKQVIAWRNGQPITIEPARRIQ